MYYITDSIRHILIRQCLIVYTYAILFINSLTKFEYQSFSFAEVGMHTDV